jgi:hypothetical protein
VLGEKRDGPFRPSSGCARAEPHGAGRLPVKNLARAKVLGLVYGDVSLASHAAKATTMPSAAKQRAPRAEALSPTARLLFEFFNALNRSGRLLALETGKRRVEVC